MKPYKMSCSVLKKIYRPILLFVILEAFTILSSCKVERKMLSVSDIHFNPFHDSLVVSQLIKTKYQLWDTVFAKIQPKRVPAYDEETNFVLFDNILKHMKEHDLDITSVLLGGDILAHDFNQRFYTNTGISDKHDRDDFIYKTVGYISMKFRQAFPRTPIFFSLGNNDSYNGDYLLADNGEFLHNTTDLFYHNFIDPKGNNALPKPGFQTTYFEHGYYNINFPMVNNCLIIGLNTIFFSTNYPGATNPNDPGAKELYWLEQQLYNAKNDGKKVWLLLHIPPGVNVYPTQNNSTPSNINVSLQWKSAYNRQFLNLLDTYHHTIVGSFAGHTHMDDFRLITHQDPTHNTPLEYIHIIPSVAPTFGNNPAYQIVTLNANTGQLKETTTYYMDLKKMSPTIDKEYQYMTTYGVAPSLGGLLQLYPELLKDPSKLERYITYYPSSSKASSIESSWQWYWCGIGNLTPEEYTKAIKKLLESTHK